MKITFVCSNFDISGGQRVIALYASRLRARGHEVVAVAPPLQPPSLRDRIRSIVKGQGVPRTPPRGPSHFDPHPGLARLLDRYRPVVASDVPDADVVVATWWETAEWVAALPPEKGAKVYFIQGYEVFPYLPIHRVEATLRSNLPKLTISSWMVDILRERYGDPNAALVPNGVDVHQFHAPRRIKNAIPTVGVVYCDAHCKGIEIALKAYTLAARRVPGLKLISFGGLPPGPDAVLPPGMEFTLLPPQNEIPRLYSQCDAWLFSSRNEGFGLPILESMACGTPVIGTPAGAAPELIGQGGGRLVPMEDPEAMADALVEVLNLSNADWKAMSDAALATARRHSWDASIDKFEAALESVARGEGLRPQPPPIDVDPSTPRARELVGADH